MFLDFYKLREQPFGVSPDPRYLYFSPTHREALASLFYGIESGLGFLTLIAPPGMGKTTLLFHLLQHLRQRAQTAFLFETQCNARQLLHQLLADLDADPGQVGTVEMHRRLNDVLIQQAEAGKRAVAVIDEAQNLDDEVLESIRLLSNFETPSRKLLQIILAGQPPLSEKLACSGLLQLHQRISIQSRLSPFTPAESGEYIEHRLRVAGYSGRGLFRPDALGLIASRSEGIPRIINSICFGALSLGCAQDQKTIHSSIVEEVLNDLDLGQASKQLALTNLPPQTMVGPGPRDSSGPYGASGRMTFLPPLGAGPSERSNLPRPESGGMSHTDPEVWTPAPQARTQRWILLPAFVFFLAFLAGFIWMVYQPGAGTGKVAASSAASPVTVTVGPNETLEEISQRYVGRYDDSVIRQIRKLNPILTDLNHIEVGQRIRLPQLVRTPARDSRGDTSLLSPQEPR